MNSNTHTLKKKPLGTTGLHLCEIGIGGWQLSGPLMLDGKADGYADIAFDEIEHLVYTLKDRGVNWIDSAAQYGNGEGERRVGRLTQAERDAWIIISKFGALVGEHGERRKDLSYATSMETLEKSLERLRCNHIDVYLCHVDPANKREAEEVARFFEQAKSESLVRFTGISTNDLAACEWLHEMGVLDVVQYEHNLMKQQDAFLEFLNHSRAGLLVRGVLDHGKLSGKYFHQRPDFHPDDIRSVWNVDYAQYKALESLTNANYTMPQLATRYILDQPTTDAIVWGGKTIAQYEDALIAANLPPLNAEQLAQIAMIRQQTCENLCPPA
jgi:aryl-alcohol dehydrogenase-like predicted oxidoreductase